MKINNQSFEGLFKKTKVCYSMTEKNIGQPEQSLFPLRGSRVKRTRVRVRISPAAWKRDAYCLW